MTAQTPESDHARAKAAARHIGPDEALQALLGTNNETARPMVCSLAGDPLLADGSEWAGYAYDPDRPLENTSANLYASCALIRPDNAGHYHRRSGFAIPRLVSLDDIGTGPGAKITPQLIKLQPTAIVETSPGNCQFLYRLTDDPSVAEVGRLTRALQHAGLSDASDVVRWFRLPGGRNRKAHVIERHGSPWPVRLVYWSPAKAYSVGRVASALGISLEERERPSASADVDWSSVIEALTYIEPDCPRGQWLRIGMALHWADGGGDKGRDLWDQWSSGAMRRSGDAQPPASYIDDGPGSCAQQYRSFDGRDRDRPTTLGSLFWLAQQAGWSSQPQHTLSADAVFEEIADPPDQIAEDDGAEPAAQPAEKEKNRLLRALISPERFDAALQHAINQPWLIDGWLPGGGALVAVVGKPKSGKSFAVVDMICSIGSAQPTWHGAVVSPARVLYIAAEGARGVPIRVAAWCRANGVASVPGLDILPLPVALDDPDALTELAGLMKAVTAQRAEKYQLIVADTLARSMIGDENATKDMNALIAACNKMQRTGATVLLVHHLGKDGSRGARGSSALPGAVDGEISVTCEDILHQPVVIAGTLAKDHAAPEALSLRAQPIEIGLTDPRGRPVSSLVLGAKTARDLEAEAQAEQEAKEEERVAEDAIVRLIAEYHAEGTRVYVANQGGYTAYSVLKDDPHFPVGLTRQSLPQILRNLQRDGRIKVKSYAKANGGEGQMWVPAGGC